MLDKDPNPWYNNWVGSAGVGPQKERLEMKTVSDKEMVKLAVAGAKRRAACHIGDIL